MNIEEKVQAVLAADAGVTALVPAARIRVPSEWQLTDRPYIVHHPISVEPLHTEESVEKLKRWDFYQVSCFADSYSAARRIAVAVRALLGYYASGGIVSRWSGEGPPTYEDDVRVYHMPVTFRIADSL